MSKKCTPFILIIHWFINMANIIFLLPPSEGKNSWWYIWKQDLSFRFNKPIDIASKATEKDLKCTGARFFQWIKLNKSIENKEKLLLPAIERYSWVMFKAIDYSDMNTDEKIFFQNKFLILSGMYGVLRPLDLIGNYKLPIETKGLYEFWWTQMLQIFNDLQPHYVVNLLPISYAKLILWKNKTQSTIFNEKRKFTVININFLKAEGSKISHWVKKVKGKWIQDICNKKISDYRDFWGIIVENDDNTIDINITVD